VKKKNEALVMLERIARNRDILDKHLKVGDVLTHTCLFECLEEHVFSGRDDLWLLGTPTDDTRKISGEREGEQKRISPMNVTHINRIPLERYPSAGRLRELLKNADQDDA
jgi:hypothetical protein